MQLISLRGKLAKKIFLFFILASFLPLLIASVISYLHVSKIIESDSIENLQSASKEYGLSVFFRLKLAKDSLLNNSESLLNGNIDAARSNLFNYFSALGIYSSDGKNTVVWGNIEQSIFSAPTKDKQLITTIDRTENKKDVYITLKNGIVGKINSKYLWATEIASTENDFCITNIHYEKIFCQTNITKEELSHIKEASSSNKSKSHYIETVEKSILFTYWPLFLDHEFGIDNWLIIALQSSSVTKTRLSSYSLFFIPLLLFSLLLVIFLSSILIRKNLDTINQLIDGTRSIINGNFKQTIKTKSNDELTELADSFNIMAKNMGLVINEYKAFSEIDKLILESVEKDQIIKSIFTSLSNMIEFSDGILINSEGSKTGLPRLYLHSKGNDEEIEKDQLNHLYNNINRLNIIKSSTIDKINIANDSALHFINQYKTILIIPIKNSHQGCDDSYIIGALNKPNIDTITKEKLDIFASRIAISFQALERETSLTYKANYDDLTKLPNKNKILSVYESAKKYESKNTSLLALLFIDLDNFKQVNDNYGHLVGDSLLKELSERLKNSLGKEDVAGRLSGDEFIIITHSDSLEIIHSRIEKLCKKVITKTIQPFYIDNHELHIGASIGVSINSPQRDSFEDAIRYADIAMYFSKKAGGNTHTIYNQDMSDELLKKTLLERDLRVAIENNEIEVHYQPKFNTKNRQLVGFEALFRWNHNTYGSISPFIAIEIAESIGIINALGKLVFSTSIKQWQSWLAQGYSVGTIAINVSPAQLLEPDFIPFIENCINNAPLVSPNMIELEITESVMLQEKTTSIAALKQLRELGLGIAIDDFGTGYSSLSYLLDLPANTLKIDRAFVIKIEQDKNALALLSALISLGKSMNYKVVAEGVETEQQAAFLAECKTDELQGYLFSKPLPAELIEQRFLL